MKQRQLKIKDLVTIGVFAVVYLAVLIVAGMIELVPGLILLFPAINAFIQGVVVMLFMAKVPKKWALFILVTVMALVLTVLGNTYVVILNALVFAAIAEFLFQRGNFVSFKHNAAAYAVMSCWWLGSYLQLLLVRTQYFNMVEDMMGEDYLAAMQSRVTYLNLAIAYVSTLVFGVVGAYLGKKVLTKHFAKAGII